MAVSSSNAFAIAGGVVAAVAIGAAAVWFSPQTPAPDEQAGLVEGAALTSGPVADPIDLIDPIDPQDGGGSVALVEDAVALSNDAPDASAELGQSFVLAPTIDTFFRSPDETTVIAGHAEPGQVVDILLGNDVIETVTAGPDGTFGTVLFLEASDQPRRLRLVADPAGAAIASAESIIVPPSTITALAVASTPDAAPESVLGGLTDSVGDVAPNIASTTNDQIAIASDIASGAAPEVESAPSVGLGASVVAPSISAPPTLVADEDGVRIFQPTVGGPEAPNLVDNIALDTITYDPEGEVLLAGRGASAGGFVQIYLDNQPITTSKISIDGDWRTDLPEVDTGIYTLRVDEIDAEGVVQSRIETPFKKEEPEQVAAILAEETSVEGFDIAVKTVQPGATLWAIAEEQLGDGILYVSVFEANRDLIRDPDLIYPGQVFRIPEAAQ